MTDSRQMLIDANPVERIEIPAALRAELFAEVRRTPAPRRLISRPWKWPLSSLLIGLVATGGVATAGVWFISQETKDRSAALTRESAVRGDQGPADAYGARVKAAAERILATTPSPPGMPDKMDWARYRPAPGAPGEIEGSIRALIEHRAACRWRDYWLASTLAGRTGAAREAATILHQVVNWPTVRGDRGDASAIARRAANAAADGDVAAMRAVSRSDCRGSP
ncbi:MAG: hypothetical protein J7513_14175 [Solirubrobacteraceae bacterium]|nr:hypothetical protein [Solirubrobacteraceae bacterium]